MKIFRSLATVLSVFALGHLATAQESSEVASLRAKAEKGNGIAQYNLGLAYADGKGIARDPIEAYVWLSLARESGARGRALDNVVASLDKASLELARQRIAERKTALGKPTVAPAATKPATPAPAIVAENQPATRGPTGATGTDPAEDPVIARLRKERDAYSTKVGEIAADLFTVRSERDRLAEQAAEIQSNTRAVSAASLGMQEQIRTTEARAAEFARTAEALAAELARTKQELAALAAQSAAPAYPNLTDRVRELEAQRSSDLSAIASATAEAARAKQEAVALLKAKEDAPRPGPDTAALDAKTRELQAALTELEAARQFGRQVEDTLNKVNDQKAALETQLATLGAEANRAKQEIAALTQAKETAKPAAAQNAKPAYPNLADRVRELEAQRSSDLSAVASAKAEATRAKLEMTALTKAKEDAQATAKARAEELARANTKLAGDETAFAAVNRELAAARASLAQANQTLAAQPAAPAYPDLSDRVREIEAVVATSIQKYGVAEQGRIELARQFDDYKSATAAAQRERTTLQSTLKMLESDKAALRRQVDAATTESNQLRTQVAALKTQAAAPRPATPSYPDLSGKVAELESSLAARPTAPGYPDLSGRVSELETALAAARNAPPAYPDLTNRVGELESQLARAQTELSAVGSAKADLSGRVGELESQLAKANTDLSAAGPAKANLSGKVAELAAALQGAQMQIGGLTAERESARTAQNELRDTVAKLTREKAEQVAAQPTAPGYPDLSGRVSELEAALTAARNSPPAYPNLTGRVAELEAALAMARNTAPAYPDLTNRVGELERQFARAQTELSVVGSAKADLTGRVNELTAEVTQLRTDRERMQKLLADSGRQLADMSSEAARAKQDVGALTKAKEEATTASRNRPVAPPGYIDRVRELEAALAQAKAAASPAAPAYPDLSGEVAQLRTDRERMQKMLADAGRQLRDNTADTARIKELETQLAAAHSQTGGITSERDIARSAQNELRDTITRLEREKAELASAKPIQAGTPAYLDLSGRVRELEAQIAAAPRGQAAPAYPDLSGRVSELETALAATKQQLAQIPSAPVPAAATTGDTGGLEQKLADTEDRLATALRGYAALQHERDTLAENDAKSAAAVTAERDALAGQVASLTGQVEQLRASAQGSENSTQAELARLGAAVTALQRTTAQASGDLAAARALTQQLQGANSVLAGENYQLKTMLARTAGGPAPAVAPTTAPAARLHVVVAGDSLSRLSQRYYGSAGRWQEIYNANAPLLGPNGVLRVGTELRIP